MELYGQVASELSALLTRWYSSSFSAASRSFPADIATEIYNIYGLVRLADEIVDTYRGPDAERLLDDCEQEVYAAIERGFSPNPIIHAYAQTAVKTNISRALIEPFFDSMRFDLQPPHTLTTDEYQTYIYGSAEVVGLMCLQIFCCNHPEQIDSLSAGARRLGAAFQKVNFLRDVAADYHELGRFYFPDLAFDALDDTAKAELVADMRQDFAAALPYIHGLPKSVRPAVMTSYQYYMALLVKLDKTPAAEIKLRRLRLAQSTKLRILAGQYLRRRT